MPEKVVTARIDARAGTVTLEGERGLAFPVSFHVRAGDRLTWKLQGVPTGCRARVRFVSSPPQAAAAASLLQPGHHLDSTGGVIKGGTVDRSAVDGDYSYEIELLTPKGATRLRCVWTDGAVTKSAPMAGGVKSGGPGN